MKTPSGFTLVEMAIVLVIVGLLLGGLLMPLSAQIEQRRISETQKTLEEIREALIGYAASHTSSPHNRPYLPCPDITLPTPPFTPNDGIEDRYPLLPLTANSGRCVSQEGNIPWATLGVSRTDSWYNRVRYRVDSNFSGQGDNQILTTTDGFQLTNAGALRVCTDNTCAATVATQIPAVILSHGKNGYGAINNANLLNPAPPAADVSELENANGNNNFVSGTPTPAGSAMGEFDDIVSWLSPNILYNRMVAAGRLP